MSIASSTPRSATSRRRLLILEGWQGHELLQEWTTQTRAVATALHRFRNERTRWRRGQTLDDILDQQAERDFPASFGEVARASGVSRRKVIYDLALLARLGLVERTLRGNSRLRGDGTGAQYQQANRYRLPRWTEELLDRALATWHGLSVRERYRGSLKVTASEETPSALDALGVVHHGTCSPPRPSAPGNQQKVIERNIGMQVAPASGSGRPHGHPKASPPAGEDDGLSRRVPPTTPPSGRSASPPTLPQGGGGGCATQGPDDQDRGDAPARPPTAPREQVSDDHTRFEERGDPEGASCFVCGHPIRDPADAYDFLGGNGEAPLPAHGRCPQMEKGRHVQHTRLPQAQSLGEDSAGDRDLCRELDPSLPMGATAKGGGA